jgi:hypothetical protein
MIRVFVDRCGEAVFKIPLFRVSGDAMGVCVKEAVLEVTLPSPVDVTRKVTGKMPRDFFSHSRPTNKMPLC